MIHSKNTRTRETTADPREIGKLAHSYAQNRSLGVVVNLLIFLVLWAAIGVPSYFGGMAYRDSQWFLLGVCITILIVALAATVYFSVPRWGGRLMLRINDRLYAGEGSARLVPTHTHKQKWLMGLVGLAFGGCIIASVVLGFLGYIPIEYMQPVSAIYVVPFLLLMSIFKQSAIGGPIVFLWPALYVLHAILILAGAPILFTGAWNSLNMLIPVAGYGLLTALIAHVYSRFALRKLRRIACDNLQDSAVEERQP
jgi:hypothetical protein